jgi:hypothetical protein
MRRMRAASEKQQHLRAQSDRLLGIARNFTHDSSFRTAVKGVISHNGGLGEPHRLAGNPALIR